MALPLFMIVELKIINLILKSLTFTSLIFTRPSTMNPSIDFDSLFSKTYISKIPLVPYLNQDHIQMTAMKIYQSNSSIKVFAGLDSTTTGSDSFFISASFASLAFLLQNYLWLGQSPTWHSLQQYQTDLHLEHLLKADFSHFLHLKPSSRPSTVLLV